MSAGTNKAPSSADPICKWCGHHATDHAVDDEERRGCTVCQCAQYVCPEDATGELDATLDDVLAVEPCEHAEGENWCTPCVKALLHDTHAEGYRDGKDDANARWLTGPSLRRVFSALVDRYKAGDTAEYLAEDYGLDAADLVWLRRLTAAERVVESVRELQRRRPRLFWLKEPGTDVAAVRDTLAAYDFERDGHGGR